MKYMKYNYTNAYLSVKGNRVKNSMSTIIKKSIKFQKCRSFEHRVYNRPNIL